MFVKFEAGYKILDNAGLDRTNREHDNKKIETVVVLSDTSDLDHKKQAIDGNCPIMAIHRDVVACMGLTQKLQKHVTFVKSKNLYLIYFWSAM